jgi:hypothetical protein
MKGMEENNLRVLVNLSGSSGTRLRQGVEALRASKYKDRMVLFANVNFSGVGPGFGAKAAKQLERTSRPARWASRSSRISACSTGRPTAAGCAWTIPSSIRSGPPARGSTYRC